MSNYKRYCI